MQRIFVLYPVDREGVDRLRQDLLGMQHPTRYTKMSALNRHTTSTLVIQDIVNVNMTDDLSQICWACSEASVYNWVRRCIQMQNNV